MDFVLRHLQRLCVIMLAAVGVATEVANADPVAISSDIPIQQSINRDGVVRYAIWVTVGDRTVQALLDTGSTGLRVLPAVVPGIVNGPVAKVTFGAGITFKGKATVKAIGIGAHHGSALIHVADDVTCTDEQPRCAVAASHGDAFLIGGDGPPHEGYSAIVGIGLPFRGTDIGNPLQTIGVKRWIVQLPRPGEEEDGHLILDPPDDVVASFTKLARHGSADADGCIAGGPLAKEQCGTLLFDTGAPAMQVAFEGVKATTRWAGNAAGKLSFTTVESKVLTLAFKVGQNGGLVGIQTTPPNPGDPPGAFILAGIAPFFDYDILYDAPKHSVALRARAPRAIVVRETIEPSDEMFFQTTSAAPRRDDTAPSRDGVAFH